MDRSERILVKYPLFQTAVARMQACFDSHEATVEPDCCPIIGESGGGKTTIVSILTQRIRGASPWIFPGRSGDHATKLNNAHNAVLDAAGFAFVIYDFRHTFATRMAKVGMPLPVLAAILGHADLRSVQKYIHIAPEDTRAAMKRYATAAGLSASSSPMIGRRDESATTNKLQ